MPHADAARLAADDTTRSGRSCRPAAGCAPSRPAGASAHGSSGGNIHPPPDAAGYVDAYSVCSGINAPVMPWPCGKLDPEALAAGVFVVAPAGLAALTARAHADHVHRAMRRIVVGVAEEVLRGELPVRREHPLVHADHLGAARPAVAAVHHLIQMIDRVAEIGQEVRRLRIPRRPHRALVKRQLRHLDQRPLLAVQRALIQRAIQRHALQPAVGGVAPRMIRADEQRRIALLVAAHLHAAMPAGVQEHVHRAGLVAAQDHRLLAHARDEEVARLRDLAFVPDEQPGAGEQLLQFLAIQSRARRRSRG